MVMGEWHSLVALIVLGRKAGSLDDATGVEAFRHACEGLLKDDYSARAVAVLREMAGVSPNLDDAVAGVCSASMFPGARLSSGFGSCRARRAWRP